MRLKRRIPGLPASVLLLGQRFRVQAVEGLQVAHGDAIGDETSERHDLDVLGLCDSDAQVIQIEVDQGHDHQRETFLHENLHAIIAMAGLRGLLAEHEEDIVKRISPIMLDWLRRNPNVYTFLTGRETYR